MHDIQPESKKITNHQPILPVLPKTPLPQVSASETALRKTEHCTFADIWRDALLPFLGTRLVLFVVGLLATFYILPLMIQDPVLPNHANNVRFPQALWSMWVRFDGGFYLDIARHGYWGPETLHSYSNWAFFPLYPWLIKTLSWPFGSNNDADKIVALVITQVSSLIAITYLYALLSREFDKRVASLTILYLALFPTSFYLSAIYPEALFLAFAIAAIYYARRKIWWLSGLLGGLAALTRMQGIALLLPLGWEYLISCAERYQPLPKLSTTPTRLLLNSIRIWLVTRTLGLWQASHSLKDWLNGLSLLLIPAGLSIFMIHALIKTGDLLATFHNQKWGWGRSFTWFFNLLIDSLRHPILNQPLDWNFWPLNILLAGLFLGFIIWTFLRLPSIYALYTTVTILIPLSSNKLNSFDRYCLLAFPAFLLLALSTHLEKHHRLRSFLIAGSAALQAIFMLFFVVGLPAIA